MTTKDANKLEFEKDLITELEKSGQIMEENDTNIDNSHDDGNIEGINDHVTNKNNLESNTTSLRQSKRSIIEKDLGSKMFTYLLEEDPKIFEEAMSLLDANL